MESVLRGLGRKHHAQIVKYGTVVGAFVLLQCSDRNVSSQAYSWLQGIGVDELPLKNPVPPSKVIEALSWLISLTGPIVLAVDQLDPIVSYHNLIASGSDALDDDEERQAQTIIEGLCRGLSEIFEVTLRTTTVLSCLEATWQILTDRALRSFEGRFNDPILLAPITAAQAAGDLITARTTETYQRLRFNPPYPSWPIAKEAFATAVGLPPRDVLRRCDAHRRTCIANQKVIELKSFAGAALPPVPKPTPDSSLDIRFTALRTAANVAGLCDEEHEEELSDLLLTALECYCMQTELSDNVDLAVTQAQACIARAAPQGRGRSRGASLLPRHSPRQRHCLSVKAQSGDDRGRHRYVLALPALVRHSPQCTTQRRKGLSSFATHSRRLVASSFRSATTI